MLEPGEMGTVAHGCAVCHALPKAPPLPPVQWPRAPHAAVLDVWGTHDAQRVHHALRVWRRLWPGANPALMLRAGHPLLADALLQQVLADGLVRALLVLDGHALLLARSTPTDSAPLAVRLLRRTRARIWLLACPSHRPRAMAHAEPAVWWATPLAAHGPANGACGAGH